MFQFNPLIILAIFIIFGTTSPLAFAKEISPMLITEVQTTGPSKKSIGKQVYVKVSSVHEYKYRNVSLGIDGIGSDTLILDLDNKVVGYSIVVHSKTRRYAYVHELLDPENNEIVSSKLPDNIPEYLEYSGKYYRAQMLSQNGMQPDLFNQLSITNVPNSDTVKIKQGKWKVRLAIEADKTKAESLARFDVSIFVKKSVPISKKTRGQILVKTHATANANIGNTKNQVEAYFQKDIDFVKSIGLDLVIIGNEVLSSKYDDACDSVGENCFHLTTGLMQKKAERIPGVLDVYFLRRNNSSNSGIANYGGSASSLLSNSIDMFDGVFIWSEGQQDRNGINLLHEIGHSLGLWHTNLDMISDTKSSNHWVEGDQKPDMKATNIMTSGGGQRNFSPGQIGVILRAIAVELYEPQL